jgi:hypothetical protein
MYKCMVALWLAALVTVVAATSAVAELATPEEAERACVNWLAYVVHERGDWAGEPNPVIEKVEALSKEGLVVGRCFSIAPVGHVVVPIIKELPPIKAYSQSCNVDVSQTVGYPQLLKDVLHDRLQRYLAAYGSLEAEQPATGDVLLGRAHREEWDWLLTTSEQFALDLQAGRYAGMRDVGPLLTSLWHQDAPYNNLCPIGNGGQRCVVGCVALACAQVLDYHEWPLSGTGSYSYYWYGDGSAPGQWLSADFSDAYDWSNIMDDYSGGYTTAQADAVAELCYEVGVAFEMDYGASGSGAWPSMALTALPNHFRYGSSVDMEYRSDHTAQSWFNVIVAQINDDQPMMYTFYAPSWGHEIVCDGWRVTARANQYHMNYGWGGSYNGWYTVDDLAYSDDINDEYIVRNIMPLIPVELSQFTADGGPGYADLQWTTASETDNLGFLVLRRGPDEEQFAGVNETLLPGYGTTALPHAYAYRDGPLDPGTYDYKLVDVSYLGEMCEHGPVRVTVSALTASHLSVSVVSADPLAFRFTLPRSGAASLGVYDLTGRRVRALMGPSGDAGAYTVTWDGLSDSGSRVPSGAYVYRLASADDTVSGRLLLVK